MASFFLPASDRALAEAIAAASGAQLLERPHANAVEIHGPKMTVTRELVKTHNPGDVDGLLERATWEMLKRNASGNLTDSGTELALEGDTQPGAVQKRDGGGCAVVAAALAQVGLLAARGKSLSYWA